jgi:hypothetical protein
MQDRRPRPSPHLVILSEAGDSHRESPAKSKDLCISTQHRVPHPNGALLATLGGKLCGAGALAREPCTHHVGTAAPAVRPSAARQPRAPNPIVILRQRSRPPRGRLPTKARQTDSPAEMNPQQSTGMHINHSVIVEVNPAAEVNCESGSFLSSF